MARKVTICAYTLTFAAAGFGLPTLASTAAVPDSPGTATYLRSEDGGAHFTPLELQDGDAATGLTHVVAEDGVVHAVYDSGNNDEAPRQVRYRRSTDGGRTFAASRRLDVADEEGAPAHGDSSESDLDAEADRVAVVWEDDRLLPNGEVDPCCHPDRPGANPADVNRDEILWSGSRDGGERFSVPVNLSDSPETHDTDPDVAIDGRLVAVVYEGEDVVRHERTDGDDILIRTSPDGGVTWAPARNLTYDAGGGQAEPAVDAGAGAVHVVYRDQRDLPGTLDEAGDVEKLTRVGYVRLDRDGSHPSTPVVLPGPQAQHPAVLVRGRTVHVVACAVAVDDDPQATPDLLYWRGTADATGTRFGAPTVLARPAGCDKPAVDGRGDDLDVVVGAETAGLEREIWYLRSGDGGATFGPGRNLSNNPMASGDPAVSVDPQTGTVHLAWNDQTVFQLALRNGQRLPGEDGDQEWFADEDVVQYTGGAYRKVIDGSDVGVAGLAVDSLARLSPFEYVLSFTEPGEVPGVGMVDDSDLVLFTARKLGGATSGKFSLWFDGSDIGLDEPGEDVDAVEVVRNPGGVDVYLSTEGAATMAGGTSGEDEDVLVCRGATTGPTSACASTGVAFDGSAVDLAGGGEGVDAFSFDGVGPGVDDEDFASYYSTTGDFSAAGVRGRGSDALECVHPSATPAADEPLAECGRPPVPLRKVFDGAANFVVRNVTALEFPFKA